MSIAGQAQLFRALADHLEQHPNLPRVWAHPHDMSGFHELRILGYAHLGEPDGTDALLQWARTIDLDGVWLRHYSDHLQVSAQGLIGDIPVKIVASDDGDLHRWAAGTQRTEITLAQLVAYVAGGSVDTAVTEAVLVS